MFFLGLAAWQGLKREHHSAGVFLASLAVVVGGLGLIKPAGVRWIFVGWMVLVFPIGWLISQSLLVIVYFVFLTPLALVFRLAGRDILRRRRLSLESYWLPKDTPSDVARYFRQY